MHSSERYLITELEMMGRPAKLVGLAEDTYFADVLSHIPQNQLFIGTACDIPPDSIIIDVGANIGVTALIGSFCVPSGAVYAVEPSPRAIGCLRRMIELNGLENCKPINAAMGERPGKSRFVEREFLAGSHMSVAGDDYGAAIEVEVTTLDLLAEQFNLGRVDLVKVDVEGFELDVLKGAAHVINAFNPRFVIEFNSYAIACNRKQSPMDLAEYIVARFGSFTVERDGRFIKVCSKGEVRDFVFSNMSSKSCIDDISFGRDHLLSA